MKKIKTVGVVGAGTMGSALAQKFAQQGFKVILADREMKYIEKGINSIKETLQEGVERKIFKPEQVGKIISNIKRTTDLNDLAVCDLIIEAIFENLDAKRDLFKSLNDVVNDETILATNTSSLSVTELSSSVNNPERFIGMHYFYQAVKNRLVEIVPGEKTSEKVYNSMKVFSVQSGKDAITTKDVNGFAINRFFVPWLNEAVRLEEEGVADTGIIEHVCKKIFGIGMGPFGLINATGVTIAYHAQKTLEMFGSFYKVADKLKKQAELEQNWEIKEPAENVKINPQVETAIKERMLGAVYFVCSQILEEKICSPTELNMGARIGLRWKEGPVELMLKNGEDEVKRLAKIITEKYNMVVPQGISKDNWKLEFVELDNKDNKAKNSMVPPEDINA